MFSLYGSKFLVTGASGGIGQEIVKIFSQSNAELCISGTNVGVLEEIKASYPDTKIHVLPCDLSKHEDVSQLASSAAEKMSGIDGVIFNAGLTKDKLAIRMTDEDWQTVIDVNLTACFKITRDACKLMMKSGGRVVCISSVVAVTGNPGQSNYAAAKAGMIAASKCLALEFAKKNITVNCILPGFIDTKMTSSLADSYKASIIENIPMKRMGNPDEVAAVVRFLASVEAGYITGSVINVSGGLLCY